MSARVETADQPDWDRLGRETPYGRDDWIAAAMYLGDLDWRRLWPMVEALVHQAGHSPIGAAKAVRATIADPSAAGLPTAPSTTDPATQEAAHG